MHFLTEVKEGMLISFRAIRANKMRSVLTTLGIVIGIVSVTMMATAIEGVTRSFEKSGAALGVTSSGGDAAGAMATATVGTAMASPTIATITGITGTGTTTAATAVMHTGTADAGVATAGMAPGMADKDMG